MKIFITTPSFSVNGGIRIILEIANRLAESHTVYLYPLKGDKCSWFKISPKVKIVKNEGVLETCDRLIITSPHAIRLQDHPRAPKTFLHMQMCEHLFRDTDRAWVELCRQFYTSPHPVILISKWNEEMIRNEFGRTGPTHYISNGINFDHFPIEHPEKDGKTILIEGVVPGNPTKDSHGLAVKVAKRLRQEGYRIIGYSQFDKPIVNIFDEYVCRPSLEKMNDLYRKATVLIKATHFDARALAPLEAMTKGCVAARAILLGDDDLVHNVNCLRCEYNERDLYKITKKLLTDHELRERLVNFGYSHLKEDCDWNKVISEINEIII